MARFGVGLSRDRVRRTCAVVAVPAASWYCIIGCIGVDDPVGAPGAGMDPTPGGIGGGAGGGTGGTRGGGAAG
eukprot:333352-Ditylum_brightwellii.AAC.1